MKFKQQQPRIPSELENHLHAWNSMCLNWISRGERLKYSLLQSVFCFKTHGYMGNLFIINATYLKTNFPEAIP